MKQRLHFQPLQVVWVKLASPDREPYKVNGDAVEAVGGFQRFLRSEDIYGPRTMSSGGGQYEGLFYLDDWPKIEAWLEEHGWTYGPTQPEEDWGGYEQMGG